MNPRNRRYILSYDIADDRRRTAIAKRAGVHGMRLQYSIFECFLSDAEHRELTADLKDLIDPREDDLRIYGIAESTHITTLGQSGTEGILFKR